MRFRNRQEAGKLLAKALELYRHDRPLVLALPRGGVPVAAEVAQSLHAPLDLMLVRKIGVPDQPELAMGAVVEGKPPLALRNEPVIRMLAVRDRDFERVRDREIIEIERRRQAYIGGRARPDLAGRTVILVDDGIATGMTMRAAARAVATQGATRAVIAAPVAAASVATELRRAADRVACLNEPDDLFAIGHHYDDFTQVGDEEVRRLLMQAAANPVA
ncbi:MAG: phosphoribosyltransferase [Alphaproteobacteria bacterium]|nr:phosphoribosyltransferase [Alphaproteobacteria bacterium]